MDAVSVSNPETASLDTTHVLLLILAQILGYCLGSLPFGYWIARRRGIDIQKHGSGNIGATNVGRVLGFRYFVLVFVLDALKGIFPILVARQVGAFFHPFDPPADFVGYPLLGEVAGMAAILGHMFPVLLNFKGGKGVATTLGVLLTLALLQVYSESRYTILGAFFVALGVWWILVIITRMISVGSIAFAVTFALWQTLFHASPNYEVPESARTAVFWIVAVLIIWQHRSNIVRLARGTEPRLSFGKRPSAHADAASPAEVAPTPPIPPTPASDTAAAPTSTDPVST